MDPEIEEGGVAYINWESVRRAQRGVVCGRRVCSVVGGSGGMLPQENFEIYESASEAVGDHHNNAKFMAHSVTKAIHLLIVSRSPFPSESASWELQI